VRASTDFSESACQAQERQGIWTPPTVRPEPRKPRGKRGPLVGGSRPQRCAGLLGWLRHGARALPVVLLLLFLRGAPLVLEINAQGGTRCACPANHEDPACACPKCQSRLRSGGDTSTAGQPAHGQGTAGDCHAASLGTGSARTTPIDPPAEKVSRLASSCSVGDSGQATPAPGLGDPFLLRDPLALPLPDPATRTEFLTLAALRSVLSTADRPPP
jgi:hypothetical protein